MFSFSERGITEGLEGFFCFFFFNRGGGVFFPLKGEPRLEKHQNKPFKKNLNEPQTKPLFKRDGEMRNV